MKKYSLILTLLLCSFSAISQFKLPEMDTLKVPYYQFEGFGSTQAFLKMPYANAQIENEGTLKMLEGKNITKIQLVYSDYPKGASLTKLNTQRLKKLYKVKPEFFNADGTEWELIRQTDCQNMEDASQLFHGFVFTYEDKEFEIEGGRKAELTKMKLLLSGEMKAEDSTILKILDRNKHWEEMLIVADLTGSMSPYVGELLLWLKLHANTKPAKSFVFFNDGDNMKDKDKVIGKTGGLYGTDSESIDTVLQTVGKTMANGWGGDLPENNIEALLYAIKKYPDFKELVMIADNNATPRDYALLSKINVPVKVVLCGTKHGVINPVYLTIAKRTKGSVHTIESDLLNLVNVNEGQVIRVGKNRFEVRKGAFFKID